MPVVIRLPADGVWKTTTEAQRHRGNMERSERGHERVVVVVEKSRDVCHACRKNSDTRARRWWKMGLVCSSQARLRRDKPDGEHGYARLSSCAFNENEDEDEELLAAPGASSAASASSQPQPMPAGPGILGLTDLSGPWTAVPVFCPWTAWDPFNFKTQKLKLCCLKPVWAFYV